MKIRKHDLSANISPGNAGPTFSPKWDCAVGAGPPRPSLLPSLPQSPPFPLVPPTQSPGVSCSRELPWSFLLW